MEGARMRGKNERGYVRLTQPMVREKGVRGQVKQLRAMYSGS